MKITPNYYQCSAYARWSRSSDSFQLGPTMHMHTSQSIPGFAFLPFVKCGIVSGERCAADRVTTLLGLWDMLSTIVTALLYRHLYLN